MHQSLAQSPSELQVVPSAAVPLNTLAIHVGTQPAYEVVMDVGHGEHAWPAEQSLLDRQWSRQVPPQSPKRQSLLELHAWPSKAQEASHRPLSHS